MLLSLPSPPQDVESYIHRSGRTGRAGRTGVSMLFYKSQQEHMIPLVERKAGVQFQRISAPQPVDIIKAGARDSIRCVLCVKKSDDLYLLLCRPLPAYI